MSILFKNLNLLSPEYQEKALEGVDLEGERDIDELRSDVNASIRNLLSGQSPQEIIDEFCEAVSNFDVKTTQRITAEFPMIDIDKGVDTYISKLKCDDPNLAERLEVIVGFERTERQDQKPGAMLEGMLSILRK